MSNDRVNRWGFPREISKKIAKRKPVHKPSIIVSMFKKIRCKLKTIL